MSGNGYIKLFRCMNKKPIWQNSTPEQKTILITLLLIVNHEEAEWEWKGQKFKVSPGQKITSLEKITEEAGKGISIQNVRSALKRFEKLGFLTNESTKSGRLITIVNWELYQCELLQPNKEDNKEPTKNQQRTNKEVTTNKNDKNDKNEKEIDKDIIPYQKIVEYLNEKAGTKYRYTSKATQEKIKARYNEKFALDDFKIVIDKKVTEWLKTDMEKFLRPETLFGTKFEGYLNQKGGNKNEPGSNYKPNTKTGEGKYAGFKVPKPKFTENYDFNDPDIM